MLNDVNKERLRAAGMNVDEALERLMGSEALLERVLKKFPEDANYSRLTAAVAAHDPEAALSASHSLKGVCGNLAMTDLFDLLARQVAALRANDWQGAAGMMADISAAYERMITAVRESCSGDPAREM